MNRYYSQEEARQLHDALRLLMGKPNHQPIEENAQHVLDALNAKRSGPIDKPMERPTHRDDHQNGELVVHFHDAAHLWDSIQYARSLGKYEEFVAAVWGRVTGALSTAIPKKAGSYTIETAAGPGETTTWPAAPGHKVTLTLSADGFNTPSFGWYESHEVPGKAKRTGIVGGLIFHWSIGQWSVHT